MVKSTMKFNCSRPFNYTEKNDSRLDQFEPDENLYQTLGFEIEICVINAFFSLITLLGNSTILLIVWMTCSLHSAAYILLTSLAVSDLAVGLLIQPLFIAVIQSGIPTIGLLFNILVYFFCCASFFTITAITIDRLLVLHSKIYVVFLVMVIGLLAGNFVIYFKIYLIARRHQRQIQHQHQQQRQASNENNARVTRLKKTAFNTFIVYILLICCYMPFSFATLYGGMSLKVYFTTITPMFLNSSLNPLLYCWRDREIRIAVKQLFCR